MTLYLSRLRIASNPSARALRSMIDPADDNARIDAHHKLLWSVFSDGPDRRRDFLWREMRQGEFLTLSDREPVANDLFDLVEPRTFAPDLAPGDRLSFSLKVNATRAKSSRQRVDVVMRGSQVPGIVSRRRAWCTPPMSAPNPPPPQRAAKALRPRPRAAARAPRDRRDGLDVHPQRLALVVLDADHVHVGQPDEQRAHARSVGLHRGSGGWTGVGTSDSGAPAPHP